MCLFCYYFPTFILCEYAMNSNLKNQIKYKTGMFGFNINNNGHSTCLGLNNHKNISYRRQQIEKKKQGALAQVSIDVQKLTVWNGM